jgi:Fanconi anemia group J protein
MNGRIRVKNGNISVFHLFSEEMLKNDGCYFSAGVKNLKSHPSLMKGGELQIWDIEDLVQLGKKNKACPYFAAKDLAEEADIVFAPYNYLVDPSKKRLKH